MWSHGARSRAAVTAMASIGVAFVGIAPRKMAAVMEAGVDGKPQSPHTDTNWDFTYKWRLHEFSSRETLSTSVSSIIRQNGPPSKEGETLYTREDVGRRDGTDGQPSWVTYRDGVYDITEYIAAHPGGHFIRRAAGGPVEKWWEHWTYHHLSPKVAHALEDLRIGRLSDFSNGEEDLFSDDLYEEEDVDRDARQHVFFSRPYCSETKNEALAESHYTPNAAFYVRNHAPVPLPISPSEHIIEFTRGGGAGREEEDMSVGSLSIADIVARFGEGHVTSVMQCAGNRANENIRMRGLSGFSNTPFETITIGMVGNATWSGPRLLDVLDEMYPDLELKKLENLARRVKGKHVELEGADEYVTSIPLDWVVSEGGDNSVLLATTMNGEPLPPDHGYPVRALIPGIAGARSVKWLTGVRVIEGESDSAWNRVHYKHPYAAVGAISPTPISPESVELPGTPAPGMVSCCKLPLNSMILTVGGSGSTPGANVELTVQGVAYSGGFGTSISSVEVSTDCGLTWQPAIIDPVRPLDITKGGRNFGWRMWTCKVAPPKSGGELWCRATDSEGRCQPQLGLSRRDRPAGGYFYNGWHRVQV